MAKENNKEKTFDDMLKDAISGGSSMEDISLIDVEEIDKESQDFADRFVKSITDSYISVDVLMANPQIKSKLDVLVGEMFMLEVMLKADMHAHKLLVNALGADCKNASLFASLTKLQSTIMDVQKQKTSKIEELNRILKAFQMELNFDSDNNTPQEKESKSINSPHMGSKNFIQAARGESPDNEDVI